MMAAHDHRSRAFGPQRAPDGRVVSIQQTGTGNVGTVTRTYDQDGRLTQSTTPNGVSGNGTITYSYYEDGMRSLGLP